MADVGSGPKTHDVPLLVRIGSIEERFEHFERKTDRIESMLNELIRNQSSASQSSDDRVEKIVTDKLESIKDQQREYKTKIEALESGKRYNLVGIAVVFGALFAVFTYFTGQSSQGIRELITSESNLQKVQFGAQMAPLINDIASLKVSQTKAEEDNLDYKQFKGIVTSQNATSIQQRADQADAIKVLAANTANNTTNLQSFVAKVDQKTAEIETQFRLDGQQRNVQFSEQQRLNAIMWDAIASGTGVKMPAYPKAPFFQPNVGERNGNDGQ